MKKVEETLKFWLEEYKVLCSEIQNRVTLQHWLLNIHVFIIVGLLGFLASFFKEGTNFLSNTDKLTSPEVRISIEIIPYISIFFLWRHLNHDVYILDKATYINGIIRRNVLALCETTQLLEFERYLGHRRHERVEKYGVLIHLGSEHFFHSFLTAVSLMIAWLVLVLNVFFLRSPALSVENAIHATIVLIVTFLVGWTGKLAVRLNAAYRSMFDGDVERETDNGPPSK